MSKGKVDSGLWRVSGYNNRMTFGEEKHQRNRNREGEESECMFVFSVCLYICLAGTEEMRRGGFHRSNPTVEKA